MNFAELEAASNRLANHLVEHRVGAETIVGLWADRSPEMVVGLLGILKAGAAFLPLDPSYPRDRLAFMLEGGSVSTVIVPRAVSSERVVWLGGIVRTAFLDRDEPGLSRQPESAPEARVRADQLAYVIYTSGSTGRPKGVMLQHGALSNQMGWMTGTHPLQAFDVVLQKTPLAFDASIWEILAPLMCGAQLLLAKGDGHKDASYLCDEIQRHGVTTIQVVPSLLRTLLDVPGFAKCTSLRSIFCGGEQLTPDVRERLFELLNVELHNLYGPTEACIQVASYSCPQDGSRDATRIPIGRPIWNTRLCILDDAREPVPNGTPGELYIGGAGLARGYLGRPDLTQERFVQDPFSSNGERLYRTGDICSYRADGNLEFLGRVDQQVKLHGCRIELEEIEAVLHEHSGIARAVVIARDDGVQSARLVAYVVPNAGLELDSRDLREHLSMRVPDYMTPATFVFLSELPFLPNGKLDRNALPAPIVSHDDASAGAAAALSGLTHFEAELSGIWAKLLGVDQIKPSDDFFDLGGTSFELLRMFLEANEKFRTTIDVSSVTRGATLAEIAGAFSAGASAASHTHGQ